MHEFLDKGLPARANRPRITLGTLYHAFFTIIEYILDYASIDLPTISQIICHICSDKGLRASLSEDQLRSLAVAVIGRSTFIFTYEAGDPGHHCITIQQVDPNIPNGSKPPSE